MLGSALRATLNRSGSCQTDVNNQIKTIDNFTLTIESIKVAGKTATARVQTKVNGQKTISTVSLADEKAGWRISSLSQL